jgi:hypothetical protein
MDWFYLQLDSKYSLFQVAVCLEYIDSIIHYSPDRVQERALKCILQMYECKTLHIQ